MQPADPPPSASRPQTVRPHPVRPHPVRELLLIAALYTVYRLGRVAAEGHVPRAFRNAADVWSLERTLHLPGEADVQHVLLRSDLLVHAANAFYATVHFPATVLFLLWTYWRRPGHYVWIRRVLTVLTGAGLGLHLLLPLAPPRMLEATGLVDTARVYGPAVYGDPATDSLSNQFAAMPSLHVGWALTVAVGLIAATRSRRRWLWLLHPAVTFLVVVGTANHYWLDGLVAIALTGAALLLLRPPTDSAAPPPLRLPGQRRVTAPVRPVPNPAPAPAS
ncbi:PAP2 superfamily protein [Streptomyces sp. TLI_235]|nr:phosphatase PAP2 family protein [Streptomyces sp. TLI_235]PBC76195.1 PAP2 superfamily protein [Streptomyces sp. TLI_235]